MNKSWKYIYIFFTTRHFGFYSGLVMDIINGPHVFWCRFWCWCRQPALFRSFLDALTSLVPYINEWWYVGLFYPTLWNSPWLRNCLLLTILTGPVASWDTWYSIFSILSTWFFVLVPIGINNYQIDECNRTEALIIVDNLSESEQE